MRGLYGEVLPEVFRTDRATKERGLCDKNRREYFPVQTEQTRLIRDLLYGFVGSQFVLICRKKQKTLSLLQLSAVYTAGFWQNTVKNLLMSVVTKPFLDLKKNVKSEVCLRYSKGNKFSLINLSIYFISSG